MCHSLPARARQGRTVLGHRSSVFTVALMGALSSAALAAQDAATLAPVEVRTEGLRASEAATATKSATPIARLPRSVRDRKSTRLNFSHS